jgi:Tn7-like transposition protein D/TniQ
MLGFFPTPYPDEMLYSVCARYSLLVQYPSKLAINLDLFGVKSYTAFVDLPNRLNYIVKSLPFNHSYTANKLIDDCTLLPFYSPFIPKERVEHLRRDMKESARSNVHKLAGTTSSSIHKPKWLRFCPVCAKKEKELLGECYWHRLHQATGVMVCPSHAVFLESTNVPMHNRLDSEIYVAAEQAILLSAPRLLNLLNSCHRTLLNVTSDVSWLLAQKKLVPGFETLYSCYLKILNEKGLIGARPTIRMKELIDKFINQFPSDALKLLQCNIENKNCNWLVWLVRSLKQKSVNHPLRHLLLIQFLGHTAESFFTRCKLDKSPPQPPKQKPFGKGPWPCLNPACNYFKLPQIQECYVAYNKNSGTPRATFSCNCGFAYLRRGPDLSPKDKFRLHRIKVFGPLWESALRILWRDPSISLHGIILKLGSCYQTIIRQATRLGLKFPRQGPNNTLTHSDQDFQLRLKRSQREKLQKLKQYRKQLLEFVKKNPDIKRSDLSRLLPKIYPWLYRVDKEWMELHLLPIQKRQGPLYEVDWLTRDAQLSEKVCNSALKILAASGCPKRITKQAIFRDIDAVNILTKKKNLNRLPMTAKALAEVIETRVEFASRRLQWAAEYFREKGIIPWPSILALRTKVGLDVWNIPEARAAFDAVFLSLQQMDKHIIDAA